MKVLITGFDPFGGESINPALEAVKKLPDTICGAEIIKLEIPTVSMRSIEKIEGFISKNNPQNEYEKTILEVEHIDDGKTEKCYVYFYNKDIDPKFEDESVFVAHGDWAKHMNNNK